MRIFRFRTWLIAGLLGGGLAYFLDPDHGSRRRTIALDKAKQLTDTGSQSAGTVAQTVAQQARERAITLIQERVPIGRSNPDDNTLTDRIESEVFRDARVPKERLNINVVGGIVEIRGQLDSQDDIDYVIRCVRAVPDVRDVHSYLHLPGTPAPNKEDAIRASQ